MNKKTLLATFALSMAALLAACGGKNDPSASSGSQTTGGDPTSSSDDGITRYNVRVSASSAVHYTLSSNYAEAGEAIRLTIDSIDEPYSLTAVKLNGEELTASDGVYSFTMPAYDVTIQIELSEVYNIRVTAPAGLNYALSKETALPGEEVTLTVTPGDFIVEEVTLNGTALEGSNNVYSFTMPAKTASIVIKCTVSGEVVLSGDIVQALTKGEDGIYVAKGVEVPYSASEANFSYRVGETKLSSVAVDYTKCFADVSFAYGKNENLLIATGYTYDFYYDPNAEAPCYIQKTSVDHLPETVAELASLFDGQIRSENTENPQDLKSIDLSVYRNSSSANASRINFDFDLYENESYAKVTNVLSDEIYHVYKSYDAEKKSFKVVDTLPTSLVDDPDRTRDSFANLGNPYSATYDVTAENEDAETKFDWSERSVRHAIQSSAFSYYNFERLFMEAYRVGFSNDQITSSDIAISSSATSEGFDVRIESYIEYDSEGDSYSDAIHEGDTYDVSLSFFKNGAVSSIDYTARNYQKAEWDFSAHAPLSGSTGTVSKSVKGTFGYGERTGSASFDETPYFLTGFSTLHFYDSAVGVDDDGVTNRLHYNDKVRVAKVDENDQLSEVAVEASPLTALDVWQYAPTSSSDESVIKKLDTDTYNQMTCVGMGTATVTFTNHTSHTASQDAEIVVSANTKFHSVYIYETPWYDDGYSSVLTSESAQITAGETARFHVGVKPDKAPVVYTASSSDERLKILSTGETMTLDASGFQGIEERVTVTVRIRSDYLDSSVKDYADLTFYIVPASVEPTGTLYALSETGEVIESTYIVFSGEAYSEDDAYKTGYISDTYNEKTDVYNFAYKMEKSTLVGKIVSVSAQNDDVPTDVSAYDLEFYYDPMTGNYGVYLGFVEADDDGDAVQYDLLGEMDDEGYIAGYASFGKGA